MASSPGPSGTLTAIVSGQPIPPHGQVEYVTSSNYHIPSALGRIIAQPSENTTYYLPLSGTALLGSQLELINLSLYTIALSAGPGDVLCTPPAPSLPPGTSVVLQPNPVGSWISQGVNLVGGTFVKGPAGVVTQTGAPDAPVTTTGFAGTVLLYGTQTLLPNHLGTLFQVNNANCSSTSAVLAQVTAYSGTLGANGFPVAVVGNVSSGFFSLAVYNTHPTNNLNGTVSISFHLV